MKKLLFIFIWLILASPAMGQRNQQLLKAGDEAFARQEYTIAVKTFEKILRRKPDVEMRRDVSFRIGDSYRKLLNYSEAWKWYNVAMNVGYKDPVIFLFMADMALGLEDFDNAMYYASRFLKENPGDIFGEKILESALFSMENYFLESLMQVTNEQGLNSEGQEWGISFFANTASPLKGMNQYDVHIDLQYNNILFWANSSQRLKERIIFASTKDPSGRLDTRTGTGFSSIYHSSFSRQLNQWDKPSMIQGEINSDQYEGFLSYDENNFIAYYMNCGGYRGNRATCDIYTSTYDPESDQWSSPDIFPFNSDQFNIGYPSISGDGNTLYFASDMPGGFGGYDLYKITRSSSEQPWGQPENLGGVINTGYNDAYPYIAGNILYFSSFGHPGFGGFDIFYSEIDPNGNYSKPVNLGAPINSSADDFSFIINNDYTRGYFTSNRPGGKGDDDIYSFRILPETFAMQGMIADKKTGDPLSGVELLVYGDDQKFQRVVSDFNGLYNTGKLDSRMDYHIEVIHPDYFPFRESFSAKDKLIASRFLQITDFQKDIALEPVLPQLTEEKTPEPEKEVIPGIRPDIYGERNLNLPTILFDFGRENLTAAARAQADQVFEYLKEQPSVGLIVHGHTDEISGYLFNFYLSQRRAHAVVDYLVSRGIDPGRLYPFGNGKMDPVVRNAQTSEEHQLNRRAEFEVLSSGDITRFIAQAPRYSFRYLNSLHKEAHYAEDIEFMVQFVATRNPVHPDYYRRIMEEIPGVDIIYYYDKDRFHRYSVGSFRSLDASVETNQRLRQLGYDTYIVAFSNGERISVAEASRLIRNR